MKTLKVTITGFLLMCATLTFAINPSSNLNKEAAKQELLNNFKVNLIEHSYAQKLESKTTEIVAVFCHVNSNNEVVVDRLYCNSDEAKESINKIMQEHPIQGSSALIGEPIAFKLKLVIM